MIPCIVAILKYSGCRKGGSSLKSVESASNYIPKNPVFIECNIEKTLEVLGGKWAFLVLRELFNGTKRFGELQRSIAGVSPRALTSTLRHLEEHGVLERHVFPTVPVTVEYNLTPKGEDLHQILKEMKLWSAKWT
ncbi:helix-turn-helix transcriptional regulator [Paenibacillus sp. S150]|nr:helix-turn-helix transcriptional regulator [Paenibacillus sp. S150]